MADRFLGRIVVAIDGPAGSGKSSVSKEVARRLGFGSLDTGAAYRALTWAAETTGVDPSDPGAVEHLLSTLDYGTDTDPDAFHARIGGTDVTDVIREPRITERVSAYSTQPAVRDYLNNTLFPRLIAADPHPGITIEGRDITTVVAPDATVRILLTATPQVRAARRGSQLGTADHDRVTAALDARDARDSSVVDFLTPAPGVDVVDTSELTFEQSVQAVISLIPATEG